MHWASNATLIRRAGLVYLPETAPAHRISQETFLSAIRELYELGYELDTEAMMSFLLVSNSKAADLIRQVKIIRGVAEYRPKNAEFANPTKRPSAVELYESAIVQSLDMFGVSEIPEESELRLPREVALIQTLSLAWPEKIRELARNLITQGEPYSKLDKKDIRRLGDFVEDSKIPIRENLIFLAIEFPKLHFDEQIDRATDVLRYAAALSGKSPSLSRPVKFRLTRANRRSLASAMRRVLSASSSVSEDVARHPEQWKRLCKAAHFRELDIGPKGQSFLDSVYLETNRSLSSRIQSFLALRDLDRVLALYKARPGVFARGLAELLLMFPDQRGVILQAFTEVAPQVSQRVLIQLWNLHGLPNKQELPQRSFTGKSRSGNRMFLPNRLEGEREDVRDAIRSGLKDRNVDLKVMADPENMASCIVPLGVRSAATGMRVIGRGSRVKLNSECKALRFFMHWRNKKVSRWYWDPGNTVDLDLSGYFVCEGLEESRQISFDNLEDKSLRCFHSGDVRTAPSGAAEFIDIDVARALSKGYRYVAMVVNSFTGQPFSEVPSAWAGVMERSDVSSGELFEPSTVSVRYDVKSPSRMAVPLIIDLLSRELIWADMSLLEGEELATNLAPLKALMTESLSPRMTVAELLSLTSATVVDEDDDECGDTECLRLDPKNTSQVLGLINT